VNLLKFLSGTEVTSAPDEEKRTITLNLMYFDGGTILPDNYSNFIYGIENNDKVSIDKSEIKKIKIKLGREYIVIKKKASGEPNFMIGYFITNNNFKVFKRYVHDNRTYNTYSQSMFSVTSGKPTLTNKKVKSINKITTIDYYVFQNEEGRRLNVKKDSKKLSEGCSKFKEYLSKIGKIQDFEIEETFKYYDTYCK
jgi:hypothetical protein